MNLGLLTTYLVGGLMMLSIIGYNISTYNSTVETTSSVITQNKLDDIVSTLQYDFTRIAYNLDTNLNDVYISVTDSSISFRGDIYDDGIDDFDVLEWRLTSQEDTTSSNPNDYILKRTWNQTPSIPANAIEFDYSAIYFRLNYFKRDGTAPVDDEDIRQIEVEIFVESNEPYLTKKSGEESYYKTVWKRKMTANNLIYKEGS